LPRKLFNGGNYSRAETIRGNTVPLIPGYKAAMLEYILMRAKGNARGA
jgi:hypothetical protein